MIICPVCNGREIKKDGIINRLIMSKNGRRKKRIQVYQCKNHHKFRTNYESQWDDSFIEYAVFIYLKCLSLNTTIDIIRATYEESLLTKRLILEFIEQTADALPTLGDIDRIFQPRRSGYLAFDGVWFKLGNSDVVLLVCFDPETFDIIEAIWSGEESEAGYTKLIKKALAKIEKEKIKGIYGDGDRGLLSSLKKHLAEIPFQLCTVHKEMRMGQIVPVKIVRRSKKMTKQVKKEILVFQKLFRQAIYAETKESAYKGLDKLKIFTDNSTQERFKKAYRSLKRNFKLTLTHFDNSGMARNNNLIECFNSCIKPRLKLMRSFKKKENLNRYLKLFLLEFRFHPLKESRFKERRNQSPLELGNVYLPKYYNFINFLRRHLKLSFQLNSPRF